MGSGYIMIWRVLLTFVLRYFGLNISYYGFNFSISTCYCLRGFKFDAFFHIVKMYLKITVHISF